VYWKECGRKFHDQFEVLCEIEQMIEDDVMTQFEMKSEFEQIIYDSL
jgi:hypothetical protein